MIGIVQVGAQAHADRYTYLSQIGIYLVGTWTIVDLTARWRRQRETLATGAAIIVVALSASAFIQTSYWKDNEVLWRRTLAVTTENHTAETNLGVLLMERGKIDEALTHLHRAVEIDPADVDARFNLANALSTSGEKNEAIAMYKQILTVFPERTDVQTNLANALLETGKIESATESYRAVLDREPNSAMAHYNLAVALHRAGRLTEAISEYKRALALDPSYPEAERNLNNALLQR